MPQPVKKPHSVSFELEHIRHRPKHMAMVDLVASEWEVIEVQLFEVFMTLCGGNPAHGIGGTIFDYIESQQVKLNLIDRFLMIRAPELSSEFQEHIRPQIRKAARKRNALMNAKWGAMDEYPNDIIMARESGDYVRYSLRDLEKALAQIREAQSKIRQFAERLETAIAV